MKIQMTKKEVFKAIEVQDNYGKFISETFGISNELFETTSGEEVWDLLSDEAVVGAIPGVRVDVLNENVLSIDIEPDLVCDVMGMYSKSLGKVAKLYTKYKGIVDGIVSKVKMILGESLTDKLKESLMVDVQKEFIEIASDMDEILEKWDNKSDKDEVAV